MHFNKALQIIVLYCFSFDIFADELRLAVASNFAHPAKLLAEEFTSQYDNIDVKISSASSGKLHAHISYGAPFDVFMSADFDKPLDLVESNLADDSSALVYAIGRLALWVPSEKNITLAILGSVPSVAIASPKHAPYGMAGEDILKSSAFSMLSKEQTVIVAENISQAYQYVQTGHAAAGLVALSHLILEGVDENEYLIIPESKHMAIQQVAVITRIGLENPVSAQWMKFLRSTEAIQIIENLGYSAASDNNVVP